VEFLSQPTSSTFLFQTTPVDSFSKLSFSDGFISNTLMFIVP
jgi:hypothetical protein